jgi:hypothetical protein
VLRGRVGDARSSAPTIWRPASRRSAARAVGLLQGSAATSGSATPVGHNRTSVSTLRLSQLRSVDCQSAAKSPPQLFSWEFAEDRGKTPSTFYQASQSARTPVLKLTSKWIGAGNGARTRDLNFGKYTTAVDCRPSVSTPSWFDRRIVQICTQVSMPFRGKNRGKDDSLPRKKLRFVAFYHGSTPMLCIRSAAAGSCSTFGEPVSKTRGAARREPGD